MKAFALATVLACSAAGQPRDFLDAPKLEAGKVVRDGFLLRGTSRATVTVGPLEFRSDAAIVNTDTGEVDLRGHVHAGLPSRSDRYLVRYGSRALVTDEPVELSADSMSVKNGLLRARGRVVFRTQKKRLQADELDLFLRIGDGDARGNVRVDGATPSESRQTFRPDRIMPPEIIK